VELKFVDSLEIGKAGRKPTYPWADFFEALYKHPNRWAEFPFRVKHAGSGYSQAKKYNGVECRVTRHVESGEWILYFRFNQEEEVF